MKRIIKEYFLFSKKERVAIILLLVVAAGFIALPYFISVRPGMPEVDPALLAFASNNKKALLSGNHPADHSYDNADKNERPVPVLFRFDPNTATESEWVKLGLRPKTAASIIKYRTKGGKFRSAEDIRKIWGLSKAQADGLIPFAFVGTSPASQQQPAIVRSGSSRGSFAKTIVPVDINSAGVEEWKALPCIGEVLASRIVHYRERVGGFANILAVKKIYGISDSAFAVIEPLLKTDPSTVPKVNLNTVTKEVLAERTGIMPETARGIIIYRQQYGRFKNLEELKKIVFVTDSIFAKISPHVYADQP